MDSKVEETLRRIASQSNESDKKDLLLAATIVESYRHKDDKVFDFQGWPEKNLTVGDLRASMSGLDDGTPVIVLQDDGMAYGALNGPCRDSYPSVNESGAKELHIWF